MIKSEIEQTFLVKAGNESQEVAAANLPGWVRHFVRYAHHLLNTQHIGVEVMVNDIPVYFTRWDDNTPRAGWCPNPVGCYWMRRVGRG